MATKQDVLETVAAEKAEVQAKLDAVATEIQALKDQIAGGGTVSEADLEEIKVAVQAIFTAV